MAFSKVSVVWDGSVWILERTAQRLRLTAYGSGSGLRDFLKVIRA